jgi:hypothetical protein
MCTAALLGRPHSARGTIGVMVGNKSDYRADVGDDSRVQVDTRMARIQAEELRLSYFETSAATNSLVEEPFKYIALEFYKK